MSQLLINNYIREIESLIQYGGDKKETSIRRAFANLLTSALGVGVSRLVFVIFAILFDR